MKSKKVLLYIFLSILYINIAYAESVLKIAYNDRGEPWAWKEGEKELGILIEISEEALTNRMGIEISHHFYPWKRAQNYVRTGVLDALITNHTQDRKLYTRAGDELITNIKRSIFVKKGNPVVQEISRVRNISELNKFSIGNYIGNSWAEKNLKGMKVIWASSSFNCLKMLSNGRFDIFVGNPVSTRYKLKIAGIRNVIMMPNSLDDVKPSRFKLLIRKDSEYVQILNDFDATIRKMKDEGVIDLIFKKYR